MTLTLTVSHDYDPGTPDIPIYASALEQRLSETIDAMVADDDGVLEFNLMTEVK